MNIKLAPSILSADFMHLGRDVALAEQSGADYIHVDVMDGHFVPNITVGVPVVRALRGATSLPLDVHLMISQPYRYMDDFMDAGADSLTMHVDCFAHGGLVEAIDHIHARGRRACLCLNPVTDVTAVFPYLKKLDMVLVMTVNPGFGGQSLLAETLKKVRWLRREVTDVNPGCDIECDGGIYASNVHEVIEAGCNVVVAGSAVFDNGDIAGNIRLLRSEFRRLSADE